MNVRISYVFAAAALLCGLFAFAQPARADMQAVDHGGVYFGDRYVARGEVVNGDITVLGGDATIEGTVDGNLNVLGGNIIEGPGALITGQSNVLGGEIMRAAMPWAPIPAASAGYHLSWRIWIGALVIIFFLIFPVRTRMALDRLEAHPGLSAAIGLVGWVAVIPLALLLLVTVILSPLIFVEFIALICAVLIGKAALSLLIGRRLYEMISPHTTASPIVALIIGLVLLTAAEMIPVLGWLVTGFIVLVGVGAAILAFVREQAFAGTLTPTPNAARPTISGPPMTIG